VAIASGVPDLLFEDVCGARVEELRPHLDDPETVSAGTRLHRVTVFLTYRCNLACPYCKTIARSKAELLEKPQKAVTYTVARFAALLDRLEDMPLVHLHFTGGEASLVPRVEEMVALARRRGVRHLSMTSNGTAPVERYRALVRAGLNELRGSVDAHEAALGAQLTGRPGAWSQSIEALRAMAVERDQGANVRLVANVVVGRANREALVDIVRFLVALRPDDVKLITDVDARDELPDFAACDQVRRGLEDVVKSLPAGAFPLLRRKVATVFATEAIGLDPGVPRSLAGRRCTGNSRPRRPGHPWAQLTRTRAPSERRRRRGSDPMTAGKIRSASGIACSAPADTTTRPTRREARGEAPALSVLRREAGRDSRLAEAGAVPGRVVPSPCVDPAGAGIAPHCCGIQSEWDFACAPIRSGQLREDLDGLLRQRAERFESAPAGGV